VELVSLFLYHHVYVCFETFSQHHNFCLGPTLNLRDALYANVKLLSYEECSKVVKDNLCCLSELLCRNCKPERHRFCRLQELFVVFTYCYDCLAFEAAFYDVLERG
jgi:hypothetical protein